MERNEVHTICRLCLSENNNLVYVFETKGIQGWTAADGIRELLRIQVSAGDIYPQCVCIECIEKLLEFKLFKERCESNKELLDRAFAVKRGIECNKVFIEGAFNFTDVGGDLHQKEEGSIISLGKDPLELTAQEKPIKLETKNCVYVCRDIVPSERTESVNDTYIPDNTEDEDTRMTMEIDGKHISSNFSISAIDSKEAISKEQIGQSSKLLEASHNWCIKEEVVDITTEVDPHEMLEEEESTISGCQSGNIILAPSEGPRNRNESLNSYSTWEVYQNSKSSSYSHGISNESLGTPMAGDLVSLSANDRKEDTSKVNKICSVTGSSNLDRATTAFPTNSKGLKFSCSDCCQSYSTLHYLQLHRVRTHSISLLNKSSGRSNMCIQNKDGASKEESNKGRLFITAINDLLHLPVETTTFERKELGATFTGVSSPKNQRDPKSVQMKSTKVSSCVKRSASEKPNSSSYRKPLGPQMFSSMEEIPQTGEILEDGSYEKMEKQNKGGAEHKLGENKNNYQCNSCGICFDIKENLRKHIETHVGREMCNTKGSFTSEIVGGTLFTEGSIDKKCDAKCKREYECEVCNKKFTNSGNLKAHLRIHSGERPYKCKECEKAFSEASSLRRHVAIHTGIKQHCCTQCGKAFKRREHLECHLRTHTGDKPFKCGECDKRFRDGSHLRRHLRIHSDEKPFCCEECGKRFNDNGALQCHLRMHIGEKPFECEVCNKWFSHKSNLKVHLRIHSGESPYGCTMCSKRFNESGALQCHLRTHTGEKPFKCGECDTRFSNRNSLRRHQRTHSGDKPFSCTECKRRFTRKAHLRKHIQLHAVEVQNE